MNRFDHISPSAPIVTLAVTSAVTSAAARACRRVLLLLLLPAASLLSAGCGEDAQSSSRQALETKTGLASFYGPGFQGEETASGETFDKNKMIAAHPSYPLGTRVRVTNLENGRTAEVRVNDRGPTEENQAEGVIIDLSQGAAAQLGIDREGRAEVRVEVLEWGSDERK